MSRDYFGFNLAAPHKDAVFDEAACRGLPSGRYVERVMSLDTSVSPPRIVPREIGLDDVFVEGRRGGLAAPVGTLASILRASPDGRAHEGRMPIVIEPKAAIGAITHHAATGRLTLTPDHLSMIESLRTAYDR